MSPTEIPSGESIPPSSPDNGPPSSGWVRNTTLFRATSARGLRGTADRNKVLRELSQVRLTTAVRWFADTVGVG